MRCPSTFDYRMFGVTLSCDLEKGHDGDHHGFAFDDERADGERNWTDEEAVKL
jgi:hypothetical protein